MTFESDPKITKFSRNIDIFRHVIKNYFLKGSNEKYLSFNFDIFGDIGILPFPRNNDIFEYMGKKNFFKMFSKEGNFSRNIDIFGDTVFKSDLKKT